MTKVLIVDDSPDALQTLTFLLTPEGYQCCWAGTPISARTLFITERPDLVIVDHGLPGEDGGTLATNLKSLGKTKVLMLTGRVGLEKPPSVDLLLFKPEEPKVILDAVSKLLKSP